MNQEINLVADPCACPHGVCYKFNDPPAGCIHFQARSYAVKTQFCHYCQAYTWHRDGQCLKWLFHEREKQGA